MCTLTFSYTCYHTLSTVFYLLLLTSDKTWYSVCARNSRLFCTCWVFLFFYSIGYRLLVGQLLVLVSALLSCSQLKSLLCIIVYLWTFWANKIDWLIDWLMSMAAIFADINLHLIYSYLFRYRYYLDEAISCYCVLVGCYLVSRPQDCNKLELAWKRAL